MSNRRKHFNKAVSDSLRTLSEADQGVVYSDNGPTVAYSSSTPVDESKEDKGALARRLDSKSTSAVRNFTKKYNKKHR